MVQNFLPRKTTWDVKKKHYKKPIAINLGAGFLKRCFHQHSGEQMTANFRQLPPTGEKTLNKTLQTGGVNDPVLYSRVRFWVSSFHQ